MGRAYPPDTHLDARLCDTVTGLSEYLGVDVLRVRLSDERVVPLLAALTHEYETRYGQNSEMARTHGGEFDPPSGLFVILLDRDVTVAGGGFRRQDANTCEVKRMWTHPDYRRRGLASLVLTALEDAALEAGYSRLVLETGPRQPEAEAMYERRGYRRTEPFGPYAEAIAFSVDLKQSRDRSGPA